MLQHDYLVEIIGQFVRSVTPALKGALVDGDPEALGAVEAAVGELLDLDASTAMALSPQSLVTMMSLSGVGESVAAYVAYALGRLGDAYAAQGDGATAEVRHEQASAVAEAFHATDGVPREFAELERQIA